MNEFFYILAGNSLGVTITVWLRGRFGNCSTVPEAAIGGREGDFVPELVRRSYLLPT